MDDNSLTSGRLAFSLSVGIIECCACSMSASSPLLPPWARHLMVSLPRRCYWSIPFPSLLLKCHRPSSHFSPLALPSECRPLSESVSLVITPPHHTMILCPSIITFLSCQCPAVSFVSLVFRSAVVCFPVYPPRPDIIVLFRGGRNSPTSALVWKLNGVRHL